MGLLKKAARRAVPRTVRKPYKAVRHPVRALEPRPVKHLKRGVIYPAAHPLGAARNAAENALLDSIWRSGGGGSGGRGAGGARYAPGYVAGYPESGEYLTGSQVAALERAQVSEEIRHSESQAFSVHLDSKPILRRPTVPEPAPPDSAKKRDRLQASLGITALVDELTPYGSPPVAPEAEHADRAALERELMASAFQDVPRWKMSARRAIRDEVREKASRQAEAEDHRAAADRKKLQDALDAKWAELSALRAQADHELEEWVKEEDRRQQELRAAQQAKLDAEWQQLAQAGPDTATETLRRALDQPGFTVLGVADDTAVVVVACPDIDDVISDQEPDTTSTGRPTVRKRSKTRRNDLYFSAIASRVLAAVGRALSATPAVNTITCVAVRPNRATSPPWEAAYTGNFDRGYAEGLLADGSWSSDPDRIAEAIEEADEADFAASGRTHEIEGFDTSDDPGLSTIIAQLDPAIKAGPQAARDSDQSAVRLFLEDNPEEEPRETEQDPGEETEPEATEHDADEKVEPDKTPGPPEPRGDSDPNREREPPALTPTKVPRPTQADDPLEEALSDSDASVRSAAAEAIGERNDPADTPLLVNALQDADADVRYEALWALKYREKPELRDALIPVCNDTDARIRSRALETLAELGDDRDTPLLVGALKDPDTDVRYEALWALKYREKPELRDALIHVCKDPDERIRSRALETLAELGDARDTPLLMDALQDRETDVRYEALWALKYRENPKMRDALLPTCKDADARIRGRALETLAELGDERDTRQLINALKDSDEDVRLHAIWALEDRVTPTSSKLLRGPVSEAMKDPDANVREAAVHLYGRLSQ